MLGAVACAGCAAPFFRKGDDVDPTVVVQKGRIEALTDILAGAWALAVCHPFVNDVDPGPNAVVGDFEPAAFTGGEAKPLGAWGEPFLDSQADATAVAPQLQWNWTAGTPETVYGLFVTSADVGTPLIGYCRFETPIGMGTDLSSFAVVPSFSYGDAGAGKFRTTAPYVG